MANLAAAHSLQPFKQQGGRTEGCHVGCCGKADFASGKTASIYAEEEGLEGSTHLLIYDTGEINGG